MCLFKVPFPDPAKELLYLRKTRRKGKLHNHRLRSKYIVMPERVQEVGKSKRESQCTSIWIVYRATLIFERKQEKYHEREHETDPEFLRELSSVLTNKNSPDLALNPRERERRL